MGEVKLLEMVKQNNLCLNRLKIVTFGQFKIYINNGEPYHCSSRSNKLWNLFKFILIYGDRGVLPEVILENLYPEEAYQDSNHVIQNMIYRLRKLLNTEIFGESSSQIVFTNGYYKLAIEEGIWVDFNIFEKYIKKAESIKADRPLEAIKLYEEAINIYSGELFPELIFEEWIIPVRIYYNNMYLRSVLKLSELYSKENAYHKTVQLCEKALLIAPYEEAIHIEFMENLLKVGKVNQAKKHYEATIKIFEKQYGILPTLEMQKIYNILKVDYLNEVKSNRFDTRDISNIDEKGAFFCDYREFYAIYILEKRRSERSGDPICPVSINFENDMNVFNSDKKRVDAINEFKKILVFSLRRGDIVTLIHDTQFIVMLPKLEYQQARFVLERIINQYRKKKQFEGILLEIEPNALLNYIN